MSINTHKNISEIIVHQWKELIDNSPVASFFQTHECYDFYASLSFLEPFVFAVSENEKLAALVCGYLIADGGKIKRFFSRRAIVPGGVLLDKNISEEALETLLKYTVESLKKKAIYLEYRNFNDYSAFRSIFERVGFDYRPHLNFHLPTAGVDTIFQQLNSTKRRDVRISQKEGAKVVELQSDNDINAYYNLLSDLYKTKIKTPLFPLEFFEKIAKMPECRLFGIKYKEEVIGGSVCVFLKNRVVYEWFVCGLDSKFKNIYPSTLATWAAIKYTAENDFGYFDMMGAGKPDEQYSVREFKAKFGGKLVEYGRFLYVCNKFLYRIGKFYIEKIKIL